MYQGFTKKSSSKLRFPQFSQNRKLLLGRNLLISRHISNQPTSQFIELFPRRSVGGKRHRIYNLLTKLLDFLIHRANSIQAPPTKVNTFFQKLGAWYPTTCRLWPQSQATFAAWLAAPYTVTRPRRRLVITLCNVYQAPSFSRCGCLATLASISRNSCSLIWFQPMLAHW